MTDQNAPVNNDMVRTRGRELIWLILVIASIVWTAFGCIKLNDATFVAGIVIIMLAGFWNHARFTGVNR